MRTEEAVARAFARAGGTTEAYVHALEAIGLSLGWQLGTAWEPRDTDPDVQGCVATWTLGEGRAAIFAQVTNATELRRGEGLPGRVWDTGAPAWISDFATDDRLPRREAAASAGLHAALAFPLRSERGVVGVVEFLTTEPLEPDAELLATMDLLGMQLGQHVERRHAEEAEHAIEQRHRATLEAALDCVVTMDAAGRVIEFNPAACRVFGYAPEEALGREMADLIVPPALRDRHRRGLARYLAGEPARILDRRIEIEAVRADGTQFPVELTITRIDVPGPPVFTGHVRDITERRRAEAELRASRARIVEAADEERRRLERDLHDGAQQRLVGLSLALRLLRGRVDPRTELVARLDEADTELQRAVTELRELAHGIHPAALSDEGLAVALEALVERASTPLRVGDMPRERFPPSVETAAYILVAETAKAGAVSVGACRHDGVLVVEAVAETAPEGLVELDDRFGALDGTLLVEGRPDGGVRIRAEIPCG